MNKNKTISREEAEILGLRVLAFIASDPALLERFSSTTGVSVEDLRQRANSPEILLACCNEILRNEPDLLMFCANANIQPETVRVAEAILEGLPRDDQ
ncbi:MAG: DUF3572 domain-containing protein [Pseudomonadota bacterium]